jgi:hypothetical protein
LTRAAAWLAHSAAIAVGGTGLVYGWMRYVSEPDDEFALVNHPWEPDLRALHIVTAPLLVFACGLLWRAHVWGRIRAGFQSRRRTGILLAVLLAPMVASGYLLQVSTADVWRATWMWTHGVAGAMWALVYVAHQLTRRAEPA